MTREEFNEALRTAVSSEFEHINDDIPEHVFSPRFERRMNRLLRSVRKHGTSPRKVFYKRLTTIAASFLLFIIATTQVQAIREPIVNFVTKIYDIYKEITFEGDVSSTIARQYELGYVPEGFSLSSDSHSLARIFYKYTNNINEYITFNQGTTREAGIFIDTEKTTSKQLNINNLEATLYQLENITYIQWIQDTYYMGITCRGSFEEAEIIKMVESVRVVEGEADTATDTTSAK